MKMPEVTWPVIFSISGKKLSQKDAGNSGQALDRIANLNLQKTRFSRHFFDFFEVQLSQTPVKSLLNLDFRFTTVTDKH